MHSEHTTDEAILARLGYKQEFRREFTPLEVGPISDTWAHMTINAASAQVFGVAFSIVGLLPSIAYVTPFTSRRVILLM